VRFTPIAPEPLAAQLEELLRRRHPGTHPLRVALDAPALVDLGPLVDGLTRRLQRAGVPIVVIASHGYYRDASLRFEYGKTDLESFYSGWLDSAGLQREVLRPLGPDGDGRYLPALRDPVSNRSVRTDRVALDPSGVALVTGELLLGVGLEFDLTVHAWVTRQARRRLIAEDRAWTLPAYDRYDIDVDPTGLADVVLRYDDPARPAIAVRN
jgi:hypothetical protein